MSVTPHFQITLMPDNPVQPDALVNEAVIVLDWAASRTVLEYTATPPGSPADGDVYIVGAAATGAWSGHDEEIALYFTGWIFIDVPQYTRVFNVDASDDYIKGVSTWAVATSGSSIGKHTIGLPAGTMTPATTNGCAAADQSETSGQKINYKYLAFDQSTIEYAWFEFPTPKAYDAGTFTYRVVWTHPSGGSAFVVKWQLQMLSLADTNAIDTALGSAIAVTDTGGTAGTLYRSAESAAVTPSNTPAKGDTMMCRIARVASDGADTLDIDAHLIGIELYYTTDAGSDS